MSAKYYTYFNLHKRVWSVKYKGKVIKHLKNCWIPHATTKVNEKGRLRVVKERRKNVHAFLVSDSCPIEILDIEPGIRDSYHRVWYNPYETNQFLVGDSYAKNLKGVFCLGGKEKAVYTQIYNKD